MTDAAGAFILREVSQCCNAQHGFSVPPRANSCSRLKPVAQAGFVSKTIRSTPPSANFPRSAAGCLTLGRGEGGTDGVDAVEFEKRHEVHAARVRSAVRPGPSSPRICAGRGSSWPEARAWMNNIDRKLQHFSASCRLQRASPSEPPYRKDQLQRNVAPAGGPMMPTLAHAGSRLAIPTFGHVQSVKWRVGRAAIEQTVVANRGRQVGEAWHRPARHSQRREFVARPSAAFN